MAHKVRYKFKGVAKEINFSYSRHQNMHEAVAEADAYFGESDRSFRFYPITFSSSFSSLPVLP